MVRDPFIVGRVVDEDVDAAEHPDHIGHQAARRLRGPDVHLKRRRVAPESLQVAGHRLGLVPPLAVAHGRAGPGLDQLL